MGSPRDRSLSPWTQVKVMPPNRHNLAHSPEVHKYVGLVALLFEGFCATTADVFGKWGSWLKAYAGQATAAMQPASTCLSVVCP